MSFELDKTALEQLENRLPPTFTGHDWRQRGPWLVCTSCESEHAYYLGTDRHYYGMDENGQPIFKKAV